LYPSIWLARHWRSTKKKVEHGGLFLMLEGMEPRAIESGMVNLPPAPGLEPADSLNYAFTPLVRGV
jgi:hypothetical protein